MKRLTYIIPLFILLSIVKADSRIDGQTVSFTKFIDEMALCEKYTTFENVKIRYDMKIDKTGMDGRFNGGFPELYIKASIRLLNCDFDLDYWMVLRNITFEDYFAIFNCFPVKAIFKECTFKKTVRIYTSSIDFIDFDSCRLEHGFKFVRNDVKDRLTFKSCSFSVNEKFFGDTDALDMEPRMFRFSNKLNGFDVAINKCSFSLPEKLKDNPQFFIILNGSNYNNLLFTGNSVNANIDLSSSTVANTFMIYNCSFSGNLVMDAFNINPINTRVQWTNVYQHRIAVIDHSSDKIISGNQTDTLQNEILFNDLISCYANFYNSFKAQGNRISANACYVEWKDIETSYLKNNYSKETGGRVVFFNYLMNIFLKVFCDYGTNPLKAIQIALYVLLCFAFVYFFFPKKITAFHKRNLFGQLKVYGHYLSSPKSLLEIEDSELAKDIISPTYSEYVNFITDAKGKVPWYFHIFGKPVYFFELMRNKPTKLFYKVIDLFPDEWESLSRWKKIIATALYGIIFFLTIIWFLIIHVLDSIALSLNVFSTLGFGQVPMKGIPRYLTILEGFIGWFLLSIFSVSLISQVIQ